MAIKSSCISVVLSLCTVMTFVLVMCKLWRENCFQVSMADSLAGMLIMAVCCTARSLSHEQSNPFTNVCNRAVNVIELHLVRLCAYLLNVL